MRSSLGLPTIKATARRNCTRPFGRDLRRCGAAIRKRRKIRTRRSVNEGACGRDRSAWKTTSTGWRSRCRCKSCCCKCFCWSKSFCRCKDFLLMQVPAMPALAADFVFTVEHRAVAAFDRARTAAACLERAPLIAALNKALDPIRTPPSRGCRRHCAPLGKSGRRCAASDGTTTEKNHSRLITAKFVNAVWVLDLSAGPAQERHAQP
jgi:hypothetical protein